MTGSFAYYKLMYQPAREAAASPTLQTTTVRRGDLVISATGTGTLTATEEAELAFTAGGEVMRMLVRTGDQVEAGQLLAEVESREARILYEQALHNYQELTSPAAIAATQEAIAQAEADVNRAIYHLEYLIGPDVLYWEMQIEKREQALDSARASLEASPDDLGAQEALKEAQSRIDIAQDMLSEAWKTYYKEYVPQHFGILIDADKDIYATPTELEITLARTAIDDARGTLKKNQDLYNVLTGSPLPEDAGSDALTALQQAGRALQEAETVRDGTRIVAPFAGTVMETDASVGDTVGTDTVIVLADLSRPKLEIYLDESDWDKAIVGNEVQITFDALPEQVFTGRVTEVDSELYTSFNAATVRAEVALESTFEQLHLPIGADAAVEVISQRVEYAVLVPLDALHETAPGEYAVYVLEDDQPQLRKVELGIQDQIYAEAKSGLQPGEVVVTGSVESESGTNSE